MRITDRGGPRALFACAALTGIAATAVLAAPGELDSAFGARGIYTTQGTALIPAVQPDGRIVFASSRGPGQGATIDGSRDFYVGRLLSDGTIDPSFGGGSGVFIGFGTSVIDIPLAVALQPDGRILVAGLSQPNAADFWTSDFVIARLNTDGTLDSTFDVDGRLEVDFGTVMEGANALAVQPDGKILVAGYASHEFPNWPHAVQFAVARLNSDGSLDEAFNSTGKVLVPAGANARLRAIGLRPDGRIVAIGSARRPNGTQFGVDSWAHVLLPADGAGTPIVSIGTMPMMPPMPMIARGGRVLQDGRSLVVGSYAGNTIVAPLTADGGLEQIWGAPGVIELDIGDRIESSNGDETVTGVDVDASGRVLLAGTVGPNAAGHPADFVGGSGVTAFVARVRADGNLDSTFGNDGVAIIDAMRGRSRLSPFTFANRVQVLGDGRVLAAGSAGGRGFITRLRADTGESPGVIGLLPPSADAKEAVTSVSIRVRRTGGAAGAVAVDYATAPRTAVAGDDYLHTAGRLSWENRDYSDRVITLQIVNDAILESEETFDVVLSNVSGASALAVSRLAVGILDDDAPPDSFPFDVTVQRAPESESGPSMLFAPKPEATGDILLTVTLGNGTATNGEDFALEPAQLQPMTWSSNGRRPAILQIPILDDGHDEGDETIVIHGVARRDGVASTGTFTFVIGDDDQVEPAGEIAFSQALVSVAESTANVVLTARRLAGASGAVSVAYAISGGTAAAGTDYTLANGTISWADGDASDRPIPIVISNDASDEPDEQIVVTLSSPQGGAALGMQASATVTIVDDDLPLAQTPSPPGGRSGGSGALGQIWLVLLGLAAAITFGRRVKRTACKSPEIHCMQVCSR